ncbi:MAG TPA: protein-glutamate O-methyltransferase CheR [Desulfotomaculum sp.]|nr:protein-glutamate O-methyltransferase CheR [Desulfotomaculum sp.]
MDFEGFKRRVHATFNIDLAGYKETQLRRRTGNLMSRRGVADYFTYYQLLKRDSAAFQEFMDYLTINVTEFFRDPGMFEVLEKEVLPELLSRRSFLRIWSAACSNGAEPYSVVMILEDLAPGCHYRIEATDIDKKILEVAKRGVYSADLLKNVSGVRKEKYFRTDHGSFVFDEKLKKRVSFRRHDLLKDPYITGLDLIICRNVQIYFTRDAQDRIMRQFSESLNPGGYLFIGSSETIFNCRELKLEKRLLSFYRKVEAR